MYRVAELLSEEQLDGLHLVGPTQENRQPQDERTKCAEEIAAIVKGPLHNEANRE